MLNLTLSIGLILGSAIFFTFFHLSRKKKFPDGWLYLLASISLLLLTAALLVWAPDVYYALGGKSFMTESTREAGVFDGQTFSGFIQILFGVPVAVAGSLYAILLARQSERQASLFNEYEIKKNLRTRLDQRNAVLGRFAKSLRDVNNASLIISSNIDKVLFKFLVTSEQEKLNSDVRREFSKLGDGGLAMLQNAFQELRNAAIEIQTLGIGLEISGCMPLDVVKKYFYGGKENSTNKFIESLVERDYIWIADHFLVRSNQLAVEDLIRTHLEQLVQRIVRWAKNAEMQKQWPDIRAWMLIHSDDPTSADIEELADHVGYRFIGAALIRITVPQDHSKKRFIEYEIDLGTTVLMDLYLALPSDEQSKNEIKKWEEWQSLVTVIGDKDKDKLLADIPNPQRHFPKVFAVEIQKICDLYELASIGTKGEMEEIARSNYHSLFYDAPPPVARVEYQKLSEKLNSDYPPSKPELENRLALIAAIVLSSQSQTDQLVAGKALLKLVESMDRNIEIEFSKMGPVGYDIFRSYLLTLMTLYKDTEKDCVRRSSIFGQAQTLLSEATLLPSDSTDLLRVKLNLDFGDWKVAEGKVAEASQHYEQAWKILENMDEKFILNDLQKDGSHTHNPFPMDRHIFLLSIWLDGYMQKLPYNYSISGTLLSTKNITNPSGLLPIFWGYLASDGLIPFLEGVNQIVIPYKDGLVYYVIKSGQMSGYFDFIKMTYKISHLLESMKDGSSIYLDGLIELANSGKIQFKEEETSKP